MGTIKILISDFNLWSFLSLNEIKKRYRRSILGPFWLVFSNAVIVSVLSLMYSEILKKDLNWYILYLGVGFVVWQFISSCLSESTEYLLKSSSLIKSYRVSIYNYIYQEIGKNFLFFIHNVPFWIFVVFYFNGSISVSALIIVFSFVLIFLNAVWICPLISLISTRYRDFTPIISTIVQLSFFATPVLWDVSHITEARSYLNWLIYFNPFYHIIEIFRQPLMTGQIPVMSFVVCVLLALFGNFLTSLVFKKYEKRVVFWL